MQRPLLLVPLALFVALPTVCVLAAIAWLDGGAFTYTLDDPYIHLALARNIAAGHYGINPAEAAAPSSSILWPFLLAPFAFVPSLFEWIPLAANLVFLCGFVAVLNLMFADLAIRTRLVTMGCLLLSLNAIGLVFSGMEHELQLLLVGIIALSLQRRDYRFFYAAAVLLPLVRYEGLAISLPALAYAWFKVSRPKAFWSALTVGACVVGFSLALASNGLGYLPSSVLAKSSHQGLAATALNVFANLKQYGFMIPVIYVLSLYYWRRDRGLSYLILVASALHFLFGHFGWYGRYEVYWLALVLLFALRAAFDWADREQWAVAVLPIVLSLPIVFLSLTHETLTVPLAASNIYNQQARTAEIARELGEPVAVNDLGLVALRSRVYVLDLWGLGSLAALHARQSQDKPNWIPDAMQDKHVAYAFVYDDWFPNRPSTWIRVADMKLLEHRITPPADTVSFYAVDKIHADKLRKVIDTYRATHEGTGFRINMAAAI